MSNKLYIGIDPGLSGGIVVLDSESSIVEMFDIPKIGKEVNLTALSNIFIKFKGPDTHVILEQVHAIFGCGAGSTFKFGMVFGMLQGIIAAHGFKYTMVQPKQWQKEMFQGVTEIKKASKSGKTERVDTKKMAEVARVRLFPNAEGFTTARGVLIDGLTDACLIAEWGRRFLK